MAASKEEIILAMNSEALLLPDKDISFSMGNDIFAVLPTGFGKGAHNTET